MKYDSDGYANHVYHMLLDVIVKLEISLNGEDVAHVIHQLKTRSGLGPGPVLDAAVALVEAASAEEW
jgi:hypothetical protein